MKYTEFKAEDFLKDEYFKHWVLHPDEESEFFWGSFLKNNPEKQRAVGIARSVLLSLSFHEPTGSLLSEEEKYSLFEKVMRNDSTQDLNTHSGFYHYWFRLNIEVRAAVILLLVTISSLIGIALNHQEDEPMGALQPILVEKSTPYGQKLTVTLEDSSVIKLNSGSTIIYQSDFIENREITLKGEAFFDVAESENNPFTVKTGEISTTVLGTAFNINYDSLTGVEVAVLRGKVQVDKENSENPHQNQVILDPYEMVKYQPEHESFKKEFFEYNEIFDWTQDIIEFKDNNIEEIFSKLQKWYGVRFDVRKSLHLEKDFSGTYENKNLDAILKGISFTYGFDYEINGKEVTIK